MTKRNRRKVLAIILALALVLTLTPTVTFAGERGMDFNHHDKHGHFAPWSDNHDQGCNPHDNDGQGCDPQDQGTTQEAIDVPETTPPAVDTPETTPPAVDTPETTPPAVDIPETTPPAVDTPETTPPAVDTTDPADPPATPVTPDKDAPKVSFFVRFDGAMADSSSGVSSHNTSLYTDALATTSIIEEAGYDITDNIYKTGWIGNHVGAVTSDDTEEANALIEALAAADASRGYYIYNFLEEGDDMEALVDWLKANRGKKIYFNQKNITSDLIANPEKYDILWYVFKSEYNGGRYTADNCYHIDGVVIHRPATTEELVITKTFVAPDKDAINAAEELFAIAVTDADGGAVITLETDSVAGGDYNFLTTLKQGRDVTNEGTVERTYTWTLTLPKGEYAATETAAAPEGFTVTKAIEADTADITNAADSIAFTNTYEKEPVVDPPVVTPPVITPTYTQFTVSKVWVTDDGGEATDEVLVQLFANGTAYGEAVALNAENNWTYTWQQLAEEKEYTVEEVNVPAGFEASYAAGTDENSVIITNDDITPPPVVPEYTRFMVEKLWKIDNGGIIPEFIEVYLTINNDPVGEAVRLSAENEWRFIWEELIVEEGSVYSVMEVEVDGFTATYENGVMDGAGTMVTITNDDIAVEPPVEPPVNPPVNPPRTPDTPAPPTTPDPPVVIEDEEVPLADLPEITDEEVILEEEVPLADVPKTGDNMGAVAAVMLLSAVGLAVALRRKEENE